MKLDAYDHRILAALQRDGRLSNVQLAEEIGLSPSPCLRRVRLLEEADLLGQLDVAQAAVALEGGEDAVVIGVEFHLGISGWIVSRE